MLLRNHRQKNHKTFIDPFKMKYYHDDFWDFMALHLSLNVQYAESGYTYTERKGEEESNG